MAKAAATMIENAGPSIVEKVREAKAAARQKAAGIARSLSYSSKAAGSAAAAAARAQMEAEKAKAANTAAATADTSERAAQAAASAARAAQAAAKAREEKAKTIEASTKSSAASASAAAAAAGRAQAAEEKAQIEAAKAAAAAAQADYERAAIDRHNQELKNTAAASGNSQTGVNYFEKWSKPKLPDFSKYVHTQTTQQAVQTVDDSSPVESMTTQTIDTAPAVVDDSALTLPNVDVKGDNLKNSLLICGGLVLVWYLWKKRKKKRGSRKR